MDGIGAAVEFGGRRRSIPAEQRQPKPPLWGVAWAVREDSGPIQGKEGVRTGCLFLREVLIMQPWRSRLE